MKFPEGVKPWRTLSEYMDRFKKIGVSANGVFMVGHGTVRTGVMGFENRVHTKDELEEMKTLYAQTMKEGAFGMSTCARELINLEYTRAHFQSMVV